MRVQRHTSGSVRYDKRRKTWNYLWYDGKVRRSKLIGTKQQYPTKAAAWLAVAALRPVTQSPAKTAPSVAALISSYRSEKMPVRGSTRRGYDSWLDNHIVPQWGDSIITDVQARPVELWLKSLTLAPKSKLHIRGLLSILWDYAMWRGDIPTSRNPMELVTVEAASQRVRKPRSLTAEEFQKLLGTLGQDPCWRTMLLIAVGFGLRISELLGLQWRDVDWLGKTIRIERGVVKQVVGDVKTNCSARTMVCADEILDVLKAWKQATQFSAPEDWMFASPAKIGLTGCALSAQAVFLAIDRNSTA